MRVICFGELMLRLNPEGYTRFLQADRFVPGFSGAEANVAVSVSNYGEKASYVTKLPEHEIGQMAINALREFGVDTENVVRGGERIGVYYLEKGASQRGAKGIYDRKYSAFSASTAADYDWERILDGADWFHFTGITPALGAGVTEALTEALTVCKKKNITVSCDLNYRSKLWTVEQCAEVMNRLTPLVDVLVANEEHADFIYGIKPVGCEPSTKEAYESVARQLYDRFSLKTAVVTMRESITADDNCWSSMAYNGNEVCFSKKYRMHMVDRVGSGDAFFGAFIFTQMRGYTLQEAVEFATAACVLSHSIEGDFNLVSKSEVENLVKYGGSGRISR